MTQQEKIERYGIEKVKEWAEREKENKRRKRMGLPPLGRMKNDRLKNDRLKKEITVNETRYRIKVTSKAESKANRMDEIAVVERKVQRELTTLWLGLAKRQFILIATCGKLNARTNKYDIKLDLYMLNLTNEEIDQFKSCCKKYAETLQI